MTVWPSARGDHRGAMRGRGPGAARGRVRWRWTAEHELGAVLVGDGLIYAQAGPALHVLDPAGAQVARIVPAVEAPHLLALAGDAIVVRTARGIAALDATGAVRWEHAIAHPLWTAGLGPEDELYIWGIEAPHRLRKRGVLTRLGLDGTVGWTEPHALSPAGKLLGMELACDDGGILYTLCRTRIGDGVSGGDIAGGGVAAYDGAGCRWARRGPHGAHLSHLHALADGALGLGHGAACFTRDGDIAWELHDPEAGAMLVEVDGLEGGLRIEPRLAAAPRRLHDPGPGRSRTSLACTFDDAGNAYLGRLLWSPPRIDRLISLDAGHRLRWRLDVPGVDFAVGPPLIGPDATVLLAQRETLSSIE